MRDVFLEFIYPDGKVERPSDDFTFHLLDVDVSPAQTVNQTMTINGTDGELTFFNTYAPYTLEMSCFIESIDTTEQDFFETELRQKIHTRGPFYVRHGRMPNIKYAVNKVEYAKEESGRNYLKFKLIFNVFKGYSESHRTTVDYLNSDSDQWQFGTNLLSDELPVYIHTKNNFKIYNASSVAITPVMRHSLDIALTCVGNPKVKNLTTGDVFIYNKTLNKKDVLLISGVYPFLNNNNCGRDTNHGIITLAPGWNEFFIEGAESINIAFSFSFIFR